MRISAGKTFIGIAIGFIAWTVLWLGSEPVIFSVVPEWNHEEDLSRVTEGYLTTKIILSVLFSLSSGYLTSVISKDSLRAPIFLGILLLGVGIVIQSSVWNLIPIWFHAIFLGLLLPVTIIGGRIRRT